MTQGQEWYSHGICAQIQFMTVMKKKKMTMIVTGHEEEEKQWDKKLEKERK